MGSAKSGGKNYSRPKFIVEPVVGQIKQARRFRQCLRRGLRRVRHECALICLGQAPSPLTG